MHTIVTGLRSLESPDWGGWGGRYVKVRDNTWLDPVPVAGYEYPEGRWYGSNGWGRSSLREGSKTTAEQRSAYFKPLWRWTDVLQNDFAARADWCVKPYNQANHPPVVKLAHALDLKARPGTTLKLSAKGTTDPDGNKLTYTGGNTPKPTPTPAPWPYRTGRIKTRRSAYPPMPKKARPST